MISSSLKHNIDLDIEIDQLNSVYWKPCFLLFIKLVIIPIYLEIVSLGMALTLVQGSRQLSALAPCLVPLLSISDLLEIKKPLPEIEFNLPEIETTLPEIKTDMLEIETALPKVIIITLTILISSRVFSLSGRSVSILDRLISN